MIETYMSLTEEEGYKLQRREVPARVPDQLRLSVCAEVDDWLGAHQLAVFLMLQLVYARVRLLQAQR